MGESPRQLADLLNGSKVCILTGPTRRPVRQLTADSRQVQPETLFIAVRGAHTDGHQFLGEALQRGATVLVVESCPPPLLQEAQQAGCTVVQVANSRQMYALLASAYYGHPARQLRLVGITGTNGKTTTSYIVESILQAAGKAVGVLGTVNYRIGAQEIPASHTTPDALELHRLFAQMVEARLSYAVMEVSSHALDQERVWGCRFEAAVFTNLSRDHYDYHGTAEAYFAAKARLFQDVYAVWHVLNLDDPAGQRLMHLSRGRLLTYGLEGEATFKPSAVRHGLEGIRFTLSTTKGQLKIVSPLVGRHNVYNLLAGIATAIALDIDAGAIVQGIAQLQRVPGRLERVDAGQHFGVFVDYAHTPDALEQVLQLVRAETPGRLITVFGCGGDRDPGKRPLMGAVATRLSDYTVITSDNPRTEDPQQIIDAIIAGIERSGEYIALPDRQEAIEHAVAMASPEDTVLIAGKGHEDYQILGQTRRHFDDREVARAALERRR
ncbi:MAG: UDP-N-acetylmuramoyl-L-alanyl-D-glutamate--2,6-diaminopimelate ligase [Candidatus Tectomicrobia bacterium]|uniref:UDP-N-acetylmuramoyl-L-alanyl-D-glutamate--2,6-diaminopimelate ligase n=1 Tax=Tectimicrobiota bacterium TaxID=2528274 RepID=A0A938B0P3_UNCTE|nr:UDP-N-acetylmuramoyl-L-alanyl-D-glutamate--2,6-diaminopimelate ligase [Candidatus Tectomicrobia bacterium]